MVWRNVLLVVVSILTALVIAECGLRLLDRFQVLPGRLAGIRAMDPPFHTKHGEGLYFAHPYASYDIKPGYEAPGVRIDSLGFRGPDFPRKKETGVFRIVALGGSTTYGIGLDQSETYPKQLNDQLGLRFGSDRVQVINAGLVSATSADNLGRLLHSILPLDPDMIVFYEGYNDLVPRMFDGFLHDYYHFRSTPVTRHPLLRRSYLYRLALSRMGTFFRSPNGMLTDYIWKLENLPEDMNRRKANFNSTTAATYKRNLEYMITLSKAQGVRFVVSTFVFEGRKPNWNSDMPAELWDVGIAQSNQAVRQLAAQHSLPLIDFAGYAAKADADLFEDSIHLTAKGSSQQGAFFAAALAPIISAAMNVESLSGPGA